MKYVVTDEDVQKAVDAFDDHYTAEAIGGRYFDNKSDAIRSVLESFASTIVEPTAWISRQHLQALLSDDKTNPLGVRSALCYSRDVISHNYQKETMLPLYAANKSFAHTLGEPVAVPDGWALVPIVPTAEMHRAANVADDKACAGGSIHGADNEDIYCAMVDAAPHHPTTEKGCE